MRPVMGLRRPASASRRAGCAAQRMRIATPFVAAATCSGARANAGSSCCSSSTGGSSAATSCSSRRPAPARGQAPPRRSRGPAPPRASPAGPAGEGEGEVYEVRESDDDVWASIALPVTMSSAEGQQVEYLVLDTDGSLAEPAVESYLAALQKERGDEDAALKRASDDAADAKAAAGGGGDDWAMDPTLLKRMAVVRDAERGLIVQELMYLLVIKRLKDAGLTLVTDLGDAAPTGVGATGRLPPLPDAPADAAAANSAAPSGKDAMGRRMEQLMPLVSLAVADGILGYVGATVTNGMRALAKDTPLSIDRVQAARLYAGMLEFGYFSRALEEECGRRGIPVGGDSEAMIRLADALPEDQLRSMCEVQSADAWYAAVRHVGGLFGLRPNPDLNFDSCALPYAELRHTISDIVLEPASAIGEHYSAPGTAAELMRRAKRKEDRGWRVGDSEKAPELPEADLVSFGVGPFGALLVEAAVLGALVFDAERDVAGRFAYRLEPKAARQEQAGRGGGGGGSGGGGGDE